METKFEIEGMSCEHCVRAVRKAIASIPGVRDVQVQVGSALLISENPVSRDAISTALADEGYRVLG